MATDEREIVLSGDEDISSINIRDYISESSMTKLYPYRAIYGKRDKAILQDGTITIVRISQSGVDDFLNLQDEIDEDGNKTGNKYLQVFAATDGETQQTLVAGEATFKKDIRNVKSFTAIVNNFFEMEDDKPTFFTIGEPFNEQEFADGKQIMYYGSKFKPTLESSKQVLQESFDVEWDIEDNDRISEIELQDVAVIEQQFNSAKMLFKTSFINIDSVDDIEIQTLPNMFIDKIKVKGRTKDTTGLESDELIDIDFTATTKDEGNLSWLQVIPINDKDKLEVTIPWFDSNIALNIKYVEWILNNKTENRDDQGNIIEEPSVSFSDFTKDPSAGGAINLSHSVKNLILDMMCYTYHYQDSFGKVPRTDQGAVSDKGIIGSTKTKVSAIANKNPKDVITSLYRKWRKEFPYSVGKTEDLFIKQFIAAFSQDIISELSVAGGENDLNKAVLPWRLKLTKQLVKSGSDAVTDADGNVVLRLQDFNFTIDESPYYDFNRYGVDTYFDFSTINSIVNEYDHNAQQNNNLDTNWFKKQETLIETIQVLPNYKDFILIDNSKTHTIKLVDWKNKTNTSGEIKTWCSTVDFGNNRYALRFEYDTTNSVIKVYSLRFKDISSSFIYAGVNADNFRLFNNEFMAFTSSYGDSNKPGGYLRYTFTGSGTIELTNKDKIDLSESKWIESERRIILPELPDVIDVIEKINNVGDFSTTSNRDLKYMLKLPLYREEVVGLYKDNGNYGEKTITFEGRSLDVKLNAWDINNAKAEILKQIKSIYPDATEITPIRVGSDLLVDNRETWVGSYWDYYNTGAFAWSRTHEKPITYLRDFRDENFERILKNNWHNNSKTIQNEWFRNRDEDYRQAWNLLISVIPDQTERVAFLNNGHLDNSGNFAWHQNDNGEDQRVISGIIILEYMRYKKIKDWRDVHIEYVRLEDPKIQKVLGIKAEYKYYAKFGFLLTEKTHTWTNYVYQFKTNFPSQEIVGRQTIYDRAKFKQLIKTVINPNRGIWRGIKLKEKYSIGEYELKEMIISTLFGDTIKLKIGSELLTIKLEQREDEKISTKRIYFY